MCGRYTLKGTRRAVAAAFGLDEDEVPEWPPRFNIAPSQDVPVVRLDADGRRELVALRWGLVPSWADDPKVGYKLINARAETAAEKPSFRSAYKARRCLIVADGFYEWAGRGAGKVPHHFRLADGSVFALAGLWERWAKGPEPVESCTILTVPADGVVGPVHDRMPCIVDPSRYRAWLDPGEARAAVLAGCLAGPDEALMEGFAVSTRVNSPKNQGPELIAPA